MWCQSRLFRFLTGVALGGLSSFWAGGSGNAAFAAEPATRAVVTIDQKTVADGVAKALGAPAGFNWESVAVSGLDVQGGPLRLEISPQGGQAAVRVRSETLFKVHVTGHGDRNTPLNMDLIVSNLDASVSLQNRKATAEVDLRIINREPCRVWTRAKNHKVTPFGGRVTLRITAIPRPFDVRLKAVVDLMLKDDGTVVMVPRFWRPADPNERIDIQISGQKLPDGRATIRPLDVPTVRIDMDLPFDAGDRTIRNPLRHAIGKVLGREFVLGKIAG